MRDRFVHWACDFLIERVATDWYRTRLHLIFGMGMREYAKLMRVAKDDAPVE